MDGTTDDAATTERIRALLRDTVTTLTGAGATDEALADFVPPRKVLLIERPAVMRPLGRVWRLGVFLIDADARLLATGSIVRAVEPGHRGHVAIATEDRREHRAAAFRGPFARGETVNYDAAPIDIDPESLRDASGPLFLHDGRALVRWTSAAFADASAIEFERYLAERVELLAHPPEGA
jgi:hypothetical protein